MLDRKEELSVLHKCQPTGPDGASPKPKQSGGASVSSTESAPTRSCFALES